ncbi:lantibiotic dehydratase [Actinomadura craniellae]|uniref:Lantibiotic dehydratase n=1 Tax=Actinomadura craniellae TaxID=2231787 RepID=A0A365HAW5_9ACTN|nr:lantibiotic dehydratase [Actinomadura craniellae]RAY16148.1 lantibiotic dehydratase [Actinomadura craniellae]
MTRRWRLGRVFVVRHAGMPFDWLEGLGAPEELLRLADEVIDLEAALPAAAAEAVLECAPERLPAARSQAHREAVATWRAAVDHYRHAYEKADVSATEALHLVLDREEVREAVYLSNPDAHRNMLEPFLARGTALNARWRRARRQMYTYVQRFCAKNETVSFFGPMAYGAARPGGGAVLRTDLHPVRRVFFSGWAARELCRTIARSPRLLPDLTFCATGGGPAGDPVLDRLGGEGARFRTLARATGIPARRLAERLRALLAEGLVDVRLGGGPYDLEPLHTLRRQLEELPATPDRDAWLGHVDRLEGLRAALEAAPWPDRPRLVDALEAAFTEATGAPARRGAGATYADRAVFFEECSSRFALEVGDDLLAAWERRLAPVLEMCVAHGHTAQRAAADRVLAALGDTGDLTLREYAARTGAAFDATGGSAFQADHAPVYPAPAHAAETARLRAAAGALAGDRYAVIDLCPRAADASGLAGAGLVVARVHHHLLVQGWLAGMHPDPGAFGAEAAAWVAEQGGRLVGLDFGRRNKGYYLFPGRRVALRRPSWTDHGRADLLRPEDVVVRRVPGGLRMRDPAGRDVSGYVPLSDFVKYPPYAALSHPQVMHPSFTGDGAVPEVSVDGVAVQRPRWAVDPARLTARRPEARFLELRRLARRAGVRFVFCRSGRERKPYLLDLASPLAADLVAHIAKEAGTLVAEAMSPGPGELWLRDDRGRRYTCELRMQVVGRDAR